MIRVRDLTKVFGAVEAVGGVSFAVARGEIVGFLGPNGAGKTTTMRVLAGVFPPTSGEVEIAGHDALRDPLLCRRAVGYLPENAPFYPELGVEGYLHFVARMKRIPRAARAAAVEHAIHSCALDGVRRQRIGTLSKGYRQRVGLAQALCGDPPILILDEPTIGLDPGQVADIRHLVHGLRGTRTVFFSSHILSEVEALCERVIVIARGRVVGEGTPHELGRRLAARRRLVLRVAGPVADVCTVLGALPGVERVHDGPAGLIVDVSGDGDVTRTAGEAMHRHGWAVLELRQETVDLEEIFLRLVGDESLRA